jgi:hypothetical protein
MSPPARSPSSNHPSHRASGKQPEDPDIRFFSTLPFDFVARKVKAPLENRRAFCAPVTGHDPDRGFFSSRASSHAAAAHRNGQKKK